jgi:hypothetical protein
MRPLYELELIPRPTICCAKFLAINRLLMSQNRQDEAADCFGIDSLVFETYWTLSYKRQRILSVQIHGVVWDILCVRAPQNP